MASKNKIETITTSENEVLIKVSDNRRAFISKIDYKFIIVNNQNRKVYISVSDATKVIEYIKELKRQ